jgi:hypothetical protein
VGGSGRRQPSPPGNAGGVWGDTVPPSKINYLMSVSVRYRFGSVGFALEPDVKPTLIWAKGRFCGQEVGRVGGYVGHSDRADEGQGGRSG